MVKTVKTMNGRNRHDGHDGHDGHDVRRSHLLAPLAALSLAAALLALPAAAQVESPFEITLVGGAGFGSKVLTVGTGEVPTTEVRIGNAGLYGVRLGYAFGPSFRVEAAWSHVAADLLTATTATGGSYEKSGTVDTDAYEVNALYDFGGKSTRGYLGLGVGGMTISPTIGSLSDSETRFTVNATVGVRQFFGFHFSVRAEGRYRWRDGNTRLATTVCDGPCHPFTTNWYSSAELTAGVGVRF